MASLPYPFYQLYFGLVPGKTSAHKTIGLFFADKISAVTLRGVGASDNRVSENNNNAPNLNGPKNNPFSVYKTCLGESLRAADGEAISKQIS